MACPATMPATAAPIDVSDHLGLAGAVAARLLPAAHELGLDFEELQAEAHLALVEAAARYQPERGARFSTFATAWIRGRLLNLLRTERRAARSFALLPTDADGDQPEPTDEVVSLDARRALDRDLLETLFSAAELSGHERRILSWRYGVPHGRRLLQREVGGRLGLSKDAVCRAEEAILARCRAAADALGIDAEDALGQMPRERTARALSPPKRRKRRPRAATAPAPVLSEARGLAGDAPTILPLPPPETEPHATRPPIGPTDADPAPGEPLAVRPVCRGRGDCEPGRPRAAAHAGRPGVPGLPEAPVADPGQRPCPELPPKELLTMLAHIRPFLSAPLALEPGVLADLVRLSRRTDRDAARELKAALGGGRSSDPMAGSGGLVVLPVFGVLVQRCGPFSDLFGLQSTEELAARVKSAAADPAVKAVVLVFDSPGGEVAGTDEAGAVIRQARASKPVVACVSSLCASAAYWLASQCSEIVMSPSARAGSVGVFCAHADVSRALDQEGVTVSLVSAGKYKTEGTPFGPLTDEARAELQRQVDQCYAMFVGAIAKGRGITPAAVERNYGQGRTLMGAEAVKAGLADRVATYQEVLSGLSGARGGRGAAAAASLARARLRAEQVERECAAGPAPRPVAQPAPRWAPRPGETAHEARRRRLAEVEADL